jgi:hypothetical protein
MTSVLNVDTIADKAGTGPVGLTKQTAAKALLWFDGNTSNTIENSFNISSVTDNSTGRYYPNVTNSLASTKEIISGETARNGTPNLSGTAGNTQNSSSQILCLIGNTSGSETDAEFCIAAHGDLA